MFTAVKDTTVNPVVPVDDAYNFETIGAAKANLIRELYSNKNRPKNLVWYCMQLEMETERLSRCRRHRCTRDFLKFYSRAAETQKLISDF